WSASSAHGRACSSSSTSKAAKAQTARCAWRNPHVEIELEDGAHLVGIVGARPSLQQFFDIEGREGTNGTVRLEKPA
ncbi:hypothetical protein CQA89_32930, partial [Klebsiella pneumoniae]